jgi:hypothetical protein
MLYEHRPTSGKGRRCRGSSKERNSSNKAGRVYRIADDGRNRAVHLEQPCRSVVYVPDAPKRYHDTEVPPSAGSIEYFPINDMKESIWPQPARRRGSYTVSSPPSGSPIKAHTNRTASTSRYERDEERGRSRSREMTCDDSSDSPGDLDLDKLGYRSRRRQR